MVIIRQTDYEEKVNQKLKAFFDERRKERIKRLEKFFGILKLDEDPLVMQRRWRDERED